MRNEVRVLEDEALGVVVEDEPGVLYGPGTHEVLPVTSDGRMKRNADWRTVRFPTGLTTIQRTDTIGDVEIHARITVEVTDAAAVWHRTPEPDRPVAAYFEALVEDVLASGATPGKLTPVLINEHTPEDCGLTVQAIVRKRWRLSEYELETVEGEFVTIKVATDTTLNEGSAAAPGDRVPDTLRGALADAADGHEGLADLDATTVNEHVDGSQELAVRRIEPTGRRSG